MTVRPAKTQIIPGIHPVWSESSLCAQWVAKDPSFLHADSEGSDQTGRMPRLIWVFAGRTCHFVGFVMRRLLSCPWQINLPPEISVSKPSEVSSNRSSPPRSTGVCFPSVLQYVSLGQSRYGRSHPGGRGPPGGTGYPGPGSADTLTTTNCTGLEASDCWICPLWKRKIIQFSYEPGHEKICLMSYGWMS